jgi:membrane protease YdiL (CAAX protease family)
MIESGTTSDDHASPSDSGIDDRRLLQAAHWGFFATVIWGAALIAMSAGLQLATLIAAAKWYRTGPLGTDLWELIGATGGDGYFASLAFLVTAIVGCTAIAGIVKLKRGSVLTEYLGIKPVSLRTMLTWIGLFVALLVFEDLILFALDQSLTDDFGSAIYATANPAWLLWLALIVAIPLFEETLFRGFLFTGLAASFMRPIGAAVVTAGLWATIHMQYDAVGMTLLFCLGLLLGAARIVTGSLLAPVGLHALQNVLATLSMAALR